MCLPPQVLYRFASAPRNEKSSQIKSGRRKRVEQAMNTSSLMTKPTGEICRLFALSAEAKQLLPEQNQLLPYLDLLMGKSLFEDGIRLLAHTLPKRAAVGWACQCVRSTAGADPESPAVAALRSAEQWVTDPCEKNRRAAYAAGEKANLGTVAGCVALAAFMSGGSLGPADLPCIAPDPLLTAQMVVNAVLLAGVLSEPARAPERYHQFLTQGIRLAT
jgi:hypothetical protein